MVESEVVIALIILICIFAFWGIGSYIAGVFNQFLGILIGFIGIALSWTTCVVKPKLFFIWLGITVIAIYSYNLYRESLFFWFGVGLGGGLFLFIVKGILESL
jgi:hypothetical protein